MPSVIEQKYQQLGGPEGFLGVAASQELSCPDNVGRFRHYKHGSIYWHPQTGAHEVHGLIRNKWAALGGERSELGYPKTDETSTPGGRYSLFQRGVVLWKTGAPEAFEVHGAILGRYISLGSEKGFLGFPTTDETKPPDGIGRFNHFEHGSIYWKPTTGAHEVHGLIRKFWAENGWERNASLGYPLTDELPTKAGDPDRFSDFENGVVYWKSGSTKAVQLVPNWLASRRAADVFGELGDSVRKTLTEADSRIYITSGPGPAGVIAVPPPPMTGFDNLFALTDYSQTSGGIRNRQYQVHAGFAITVEGANDPDCSLSLTFEMRFDRPSRKVQVILRNWNIHTEVDWPTNWYISAEEINALLKPKLNAKLNQPINVADIPEFLNVLSLKVMPNGDLNIYTEPL